MNNERLQKLRERADLAVKIGARISAVTDMSVFDAATVLKRSYSQVLHDDWMEWLELGRKAFVAKLDKELESLIAVEPVERIPEPTKEPEEKYDPASRISDPDTMVGCG